MLKNNLFEKFFKKTKSRGFVQGVFVILFLIFTDQIIKFFIRQNFYFVCNKGIAFGIKLPTVFFVTIWILIMFYFLKIWLNDINKNIFFQLPFVLIITGGFSNIIDRIIYGCVIDFIPFLNISTFNLADSFITIGIVLLLSLNYKK